MFKKKLPVIEQYGINAFRHVLSTITASQIRDAVVEAMRQYEDSVYDDPKNSKLLLTNSDVLGLVIVSILESGGKVPVQTLISLDTMGYTLQDAVLIDMLIEVAIKDKEDFNKLARRWLALDEIRPESRIFMQAFLQRTMEYLNKDMLTALCMSLGKNDNLDELRYRLTYDMVALLLDDPADVVMPYDLMGISKAFNDYVEHNGIALHIED